MTEKLILDAETKKIISTLVDQGYVLVGINPIDDPNSQKLHKQYEVNYGQIFHQQGNSFRNNCAIGVNLYFAKSH